VLIQSWRVIEERNGQQGSRRKCSNQKDKTPGIEVLLQEILTTGRSLVDLSVPGSFDLFGHPRVMSSRSAET
jgi:hypothetical protein